MNSPLFDIYDPQGAVGDQQEYDPLTGTFKKRKPRLEDLLPEQEKASMLGQLANAGASGLSAFGWLLDTPGAVVRGTLSGGLGKGLSALIEDSEDRVTGRELLRQYGLVGDEDNWGNFGSGLATELFLDPLTYASLGATALLKRGAQTAAGRAAERAALLSDDVGLLAERAARTGVVDNIGPATFMRNATPEAAARLQADEAAELAGRGIDDPMVRTSQMDAARAQAMLDARAAFNQVGGTDALWSSPLARSNRVTIPYVVNDAFDLWDNVIPGAGDALARTSDNLGIAAQRTPILGGALRAANALIDPKLFGFQDERGQRLGRRLTERGNQFGREIDREIADVSVDVARDIGEDLYRSQEFADAFGMAGENQMGMVKNPRMVAALNSPAGQRLLRFAEDVKRRAREEADRYGIPLERVTLPNDIEYFPRQAVEVVNPRTAAGWAAKPLSPLRGTAIASVSDGGKAARRDYTRAFPRWVLDDMARSGDLQKALRDAPDTDVESIIDEWFAGNAADFAPIASGQRVFDYMADGIDPGDFSPEALAKAEQVAARQRQAYKDLADSLRRSPLQMAEQQIPRFGNSINDLTSYARRQAQRQATADVLLGEMADPENVLRQAADEVPGGAVYSAEDALRTFNFDLEGIDEFKAGIAAGKDVRPPPGVRALAERLGIPPNELLTNVSFGREFIDKLNTKIVKARSPAEAAPLLKAIDWYTQSFKQLALLWPARYTRDAYSGSFAGATKGAYSPLDWAAGARAGGGNYDAIAARLENAPGYRESDLFPSGAASPEELREARIRKFLKGAGGVALTQSNVVDDVGRQVNNLAYREQYPGGAGGFLQGLREKFRRNPIPWDLYTNRTSAGNSNWLLDLGDRAASFTDAGNRIGSYLTRIRRGDAPLAAKRIADLTQVNYSPSNFTSFERDFLKRIFPFYSYTKGITPLVFNELTENPAGLMGQSIRVVNRSSEPSENQFTPEYLRQSAAIPLDGAVPFLGLETPGITRFLTNVDLPHESVLNLFTPGVSNTLPGTIGGALAKTGSNILGQSNPLIKGPLEYVLNRQFYSGRQLSDLYSVLEQSLGPAGRGLEQVAVNLPGGSRAIGAFRQAIDQRISPQERAAKFLFNALTGLKLQDVDQEKTVRLAARTTLNDLLDQAPGMSTYENLFIKPEDLVKLSPEEKRQYLLYRVLQSEASRNARERKKNDALAPFGL